MRLPSLFTRGRAAVAIAILAAGGAASAAVIQVPAGADLQKALDGAAPGDTLVLAAGAVYKGPFLLAAKRGDGWITVTTSASSNLPPAGTRIRPAHAPYLPKLVAPDTRGAIVTAPAAHHYRFIGIEVLPSQGKYVNQLVRLGSADATRLDELAHDFEFDRVYIHGDPAVGSKRGIELNSIGTAIENSHISDIKGVGEDTQAICGWNGPGPYRIVNNYLEGAGENVMFGGGDPQIPNLVPSDIEIRRNYFFKPLSWKKGEPAFAGTEWTVKNLFELKFARRVKITDNIFENNWGQAQTGFAILFTVKAPRYMTWAVVEDVEFSGNIVRHAASGVNITGSGEGIGHGRRIKIRNNIFEDIDGRKWWGDGRLFQILTGAQDVIIDHNTSLRHEVVIVADEAPSPGLRFTNNLMLAAGGVKGSGAGEGRETLALYFPGSVFQNNVLIGGSGGSYPKGNFFPGSLKSVKFENLDAGDIRLSSSSPFHGKSEGANPGADIEGILAATAGVKEGVPGSAAPAASRMAKK